MGLRITEELIGMPQVNAALFRLAGPDLRLAVEQGLFQAGSVIEGDAKELVPVDTGNLRDSGFTITSSLEMTGPTAEIDPESRASVESDNPSVISAVVGFGGPAQEYAIVQHERLDFHHRIGQAKYLETAVNQHVEDIAPTIAEKVQAMIEGRSAEGSGAGIEGSGFE
jgi:hypothetical protein